MAISPPSARRCLRATIFPSPRARFWSPSCRRRWPVSSPRENGSARTGLGASRAKPARRRRSCWRRKRRRGSGAADPPSARQRPAQRRPDAARPAVRQHRAASSRRWPSLPTCRSRACRRWCMTAAAPGLRALFDQAGLPASTYPAFRRRSRPCTRAASSASPAVHRLKRRMVERVLTRCAEALRRPRAAADAVAALRHRSRARRSAPVLRRAGLRHDLSDPFARPFATLALPLWEGHKSPKAIFGEG